MLYLQLFLWVSILASPWAAAKPLVAGDRRLDRRAVDLPSFRSVGLKIDTDDADRRRARPPPWLVDLGIIPGLTSETAMRPYVVSDGAGEVYKLSVSEELGVLLGTSAWLVDEDTGVRRTAVKLQKLRLMAWRHAVGKRKMGQLRYVVSEALSEFETVQYVDATRHQAVAGDRPILRKGKTANYYSGTPALAGLLHGALVPHGIQKSAEMLGKQVVQCTAVYFPSIPGGYDLVTVVE